MSEPRLEEVRCLHGQSLHRMAYWEWGDAACPDVLLCLHGLTRQGRDFDTLARAMAPEYRVVCPDGLGRGRSDWLADPMGYFGPHTDAQSLALTVPQLKADAERGGFVPRCDASIAVPFKAITPELATLGEAMLWQSYDKLCCPTLLLRGADSDLLSHVTAVAMTQRGPRAVLHEFAGIGHAPTLVQDDQIAVVRRFLLSP